MQTGLYIFECGAPTSIPETTIKNKLFPNPAKNQFIVISSTANKITLYNILGKKVKEQKLNTAQNIIEKGNLNNGLYFYNLNNEDNLIESGKVIFE